MTIYYPQANEALNILMKSISKELRLFNEVEKKVLIKFFNDANCNYVRVYKFSDFSNKENIISNLKEMKDNAITKHDYEKAARLRDSELEYMDALNTFNLLENNKCVYSYNEKRVALYSFNDEETNNSMASLKEININVIYPFSIIVDDKFKI